FSCLWSQKVFTDHSRENFKTTVTSILPLLQYHILCLPLYKNFMIKVTPIVYSLLLATTAIGEDNGKGKPGRLRIQDIGHGRILEERNIKPAKAEVGKVKLCHNDNKDEICPWKNIEPSANALKAHLAHGDYEG
ncbi:hypothetical protein ACHAWX_004844, partial [Stephanocyclus meneghinianus]